MHVQRFPALPHAASSKLDKKQLWESGPTRFAIYFGGLFSCRLLLLVLTIYLLLLAVQTYFLDIKMAETRKPNKLYATHPSNYGKGSRSCRVTGRQGGMGLIRKYGINMKRQAFRERAEDMGFKKYS